MDCKNFKEEPSTQTPEHTALQQAIRNHWGKINHQRLRIVNKYAGISVLDLGCASGDYVSFLNQKGYFACGLDFMQYQEWIYPDNPPFVRANAERLPFKDCAFDTVLGFEILEHLLNPEQMVKEIYRVCRKNAILSVPDCSTQEDMLRAGLVYSHWIDKSHRHFFDEDSIEKLIAKNGFHLDSLLHINPVMIDYLGFRSLAIPKILAYPISRITTRLPFRRQFRMTLLAVITK